MARRRAGRRVVRHQLRGGRGDVALRGDAANEKVYEVTDEVVGVPDRCMESHFEYGTKAAWWRIADPLERLGVPTTVSTCGKAAELSPWLIEDAVKRGHEISCHGWRWEGMPTWRKQTSARHRAHGAVLTELAGTPPVGWHTRSTPSPNTRRLLVEHGGFLYDCDAYYDDLPFFVEVAGKRHLVLPYAFDTNDMRYHRGARFVFGEDFSRYSIDAFDRLYAEGAAAPRDDVGRPASAHHRRPAASAASSEAPGAYARRRPASGSHAATRSPGTGSLGLRLRRPERSEGPHRRSQSARDPFD